MSATERLRELLDERGVRWKRKRGRKHDGTEWYDQFGVYVEAVQEYSWDGFEHPEGKLLVRRGMGYLTTEQAIDATLGAGTCNDKCSRFNAWVCSECNATVLLMFDDYGEPSYSVDGIADLPRFCPNCGRKVVSE